MYPPAHPTTHPAPHPSPTHPLVLPSLHPSSNHPSTHPSIPPYSFLPHPFTNPSAHCPSIHPSFHSLSIHLPSLLPSLHPCTHLPSFFPPSSIHSPIHHFPIFLSSTSPPAPLAIGEENKEWFWDGWEAPCAPAPGGSPFIGPCALAWPLDQAVLGMKRRWSRCSPLGTYSHSREGADTTDRHRECDPGCGDAGQWASRQGMKLGAGRLQKSSSLRRAVWLRTQTPTSLGLLFCTQVPPHPSLGPS